MTKIPAHIIDHMHHLDQTQPPRTRCHTCETYDSDSDIRGYRWYMWATHYVSATADTAPDELPAIEHMQDMGHHLARIDYYDGSACPECADPSSADATAEPDADGVWQWTAHHPAAEMDPDTDQ